MIVRQVENSLPARAVALVRAAVVALAVVVAVGPGLATSAGAAETINGSGSRLKVEVDKGTMVRLSGPASTVFVANPAIADIQVKSPTVIYLFGKAPGETTLFAVNARGGLLLNSDVIVTHNLASLNEALRDVLPEADITARSVRGAVVLSGTVTSAGEAEDARQIAEQFVPSAEKVINRIDVEGPNQVTLRVRIIETSRTVLRDLGVNWDAVFSVGKNFAFGLFTGGATTLTNTFPPSGVFGTRVGGVNNFAGTFNNGNGIQVNSLIDALETEGLIKTLAEPTLTAVSGETAEFLAGGEFPIVVPQKDNANTIEFKQFGVSLSFTPTLVSGNRISLKVEPEVSQLSQAGSVNQNGFSVSALTTRRTKTTVELASGQSFAIAGLLQNNVNYDINKVPGLGDVPILGHLFRSQNFRRNETELVIIITPYVVRPFTAKPKNPVQAQASPSANVERIFFGPEHRGSARPGESPVGGERRLVGPVGFILE
jgi:pilus assembly protein CpaC